MQVSDAEIFRRIAENAQQIRGQIAAAALRSGRSPDEVTLVGVTKYVGTRAARLLVEAGITDLGESRPQELWTKAEALSELPIAWHLVGHLQRNKVRRTLRPKLLIHSADSLRLLETISREVSESTEALPVSVLLEINISGDATKHGLQPDEAEPLLIQAAQLPHMSIRGLMTMAALEGGAERARRDFAALRDLRGVLAANAPPNVSLDELSMGMSGDFEVAIEEGATIVRVGSALFEGVTDD